MVTEKTKRKGAPKWATEPFHELYDHIERQSHLLRLSRRGISGLQGLPELIEALQGVGDKESDVKNGELELKHAKEEADLAKREVEEGFPLLHEQAAISLWAMLESTMSDFFSRWIAHNKEIYHSPEMQKIKVRVFEYEMLTKYEKTTHIIELMQRELSMTYKHGIKRYEHIMKQIGLCWDVDSDVQRELMELNIVRNYCVHKKSIADGNFKKLCPWYKIANGKKVIVTPQKYSLYENAVGAYSVSIIVRLGERYGKNMSKHYNACKMRQVVLAPKKS